MKMTPPLNNLRQAGFSLVEMAVVLVILGLVLASLLLPLAAQRDQNFSIATQNSLTNAQKALLGYAQAKGRLPCPAPLTTINGLEDPLNGGTCTVAAGYLPAATLGLQPINSNGLLLDGWNNPIRYAVTQFSYATPPAQPDPPNYDFTTVDGINTTGIDKSNPKLIVCNDSSAANCSTTNYLINNAAAVIFSTGANFPQSAGPDEITNLNGTSAFYSREPTVAGSAMGEFDDMVVWISPYLLYNAMIQAGQLH